LESGIQPEKAFSAPPSIVSGMSSPASKAASAPMVSDSLGLSYLIRAYQDRGHEVANLDPLGIHSFRRDFPAELDYKYHGFTDADLDRKLNLYGTSSGGNVGFLDILGSRPTITLRQVVANLQKTYCGSLGVEYTHMQSREKCNWIRSQVETPKWMSFSNQKKLHIYERLCFADHFEKFLANKFNTAKRFGLEGGESSIPGLKYLVDRGSELGVQSFTLGMPHRGIG
jgi:2-oxoglutarate dehydrogenase E1 component